MTERTQHRYPTVNADEQRLSIVRVIDSMGVKLRSVAFGLAPAPTAKDDLAIDRRQIARFDAGRITLT